MKHLIIIGVGVLSDIVYEYALKSNSYNKDWVFKGYLYGDNDSHDDIVKKAPIAKINQYEIQPDDVFVCSYFDTNNREEACRALLMKGAEFVNVVHPSANIFSSAVLGVGNVIGAFVTISANATIGNMNMIQDHCNIGHDSTIEDYNHLFVNSVLCGNNKIASMSSLYTCSLLYPGIRVGDSAVVSAGSVVMRHVKDGTTVMGNPAKKIEN